MANNGVREQTVVFLRHGVAHHNFHGADLRSPQLFDPPLTRDGKISAVQAGDKIQYWWSTTQGGNRIETVITSPLSRTLQTATLAFLPGEAYGEECVPFLCVENVREAYGMHYPDKRRKRSVLMKHWPAVKFDDSMTENDDHWSPVNRETRDDVANRVNSFLKWLCKRKETNIVVVSHGVWIETCLATFCPGALGDRRVYNCDAYAAKLISRNGQLLNLSDARLVE